MTISEFLRSLKPSGEGSFEDLIGELLGTLTGLQFYAARSGDQGGRDGRAKGSAGEDIVFECKRYSGDTALRDREVIGELAQAHLRLPQLDLWIIAASREITDQNLSWLEAFGQKHAIDILTLESLKDGSGNLDSLAGEFPEVIERFAQPEQLTDLREALNKVAKGPGVDALLASLKKRLLKPDAGWPSWRESSHQEWNRIVNEEAASRSRFGQPLDVLSGGSIPRKDAEAALDDWWHNQPSKIFAMTGEEGDGKSWSVAQWLTNQIQNTQGPFPPIVFIPSRDAGSAKSMEDLVLENVRRLLPSDNWSSKLYRWLDYRDVDAKEPIAVVVLDGLNEHHSADYWQSVIESSFDKPWAGKIRLICTARSQYWDEFFAKRTSVPANRFKLQSFDDAELQLALNKRGLKLPDFPEELRPLLRKPRYFDLATKYRELLSESGDFTLARLYFEDWRDRCNRNNPGISEDAFNDFLRQIAERYRDGVQRLARSDIEQYVGFDPDSRSTFIDLTTGGVLEKDGGRWRVSEARLPMALGLLLGDELASEKENANLKERIAAWLEPHSGSDMEALIIEYAVLACVARVAPTAIVATLLQAWIDTQNPRSPVGGPIERRLTAYMPQCLDAYVELAKAVWSSEKEHPWAQEVLISGFSFWVQKSASVVEQLTPVLEDWLSMVPVDGPPMFRRMPFIGPSPKPDSRVRTLWPDAETNRNYDLDGYALHVVDDDGWLRLSHAAFVIISFITDRRPVARAFVAFSIAKAIHQSADGQNELRWAIRSSKFDLEPLLVPSIQRLLAEPSGPVQWACSRLLRMMGTEGAWEMLASIDEDALYPQSDLEVESRKNPVESIYQCTIKDLEEYATREDFKPWRFIDSAEAFAADTDLNLPRELSKRLEPILQQLGVTPVWQGPWQSGEDHFLEQAEIVLSRMDPGAIANVIRRIVKTAQARTVEPLYSLAFRLSEYDLLLDSDTRTTLEMARQSNPAIQGPEDSKGTHCEFFIFSRVLPLWTGNGQLERLLARPPEANDWIDFEHSYKGPVEGTLPQCKVPRDWFRILYYLSVLGEDKLNDDALRSAFDTGDSLVRGSLYRYLLFSNVSNERCDPLVSDWSWNSEMHPMEQTFGSLLLIKLAQEKQEPAPWKRVDPTFRATALLRAGGPEPEWGEYAKWFTKMITDLQVPLPEDDVPAYEITYSAQETGRPGRVSLAPEPSRSIRFVAPERHWGGRAPEGNPFAGLAEEPDAIRERTKLKNQQLRELNERATKRGNFWMERCFPRDAIEAMFDHAPTVIDGSLRSLLDQETPRVSFAAVSYYTALAEVLISKSDRGKDAIALIQILRSMGYGIRIIDGDTQLNQLDLDLFGAAETSVATSLWDQELNACSSDLDLLELAIKVRYSASADSAKWLNEVIDRDLKSESPFDKARAVSLRGFLETEPEAPWLTEPTKDDDSWYRSVLRSAQRRVKSERDARHWFKKFCEHTDLDEACAAFRLFLTIADRRCWLWCFDELSVLGEDNPRRRFFESNRDEIRKACKGNEKKLPKSFVGCEVADQMSPWRS
jgi:Restriction endonuclease